MRLDKYLKISRLIKRRTVANEACDNGRVTLNGRVFGNRETRVEVLTVQENVRKEAAADLFRYLPASEQETTSEESSEDVES